MSSAPYVFEMVKAQPLAETPKASAAWKPWSAKKNKNSKKMDELGKMCVAGDGRYDEERREIPK